jgi:2-succinyl-5-enolpyruvyl-6-hydroxy-3-cyclohexene-1-carboxylate synthase
VGDLSFLHDLNALVAARRLDLSATVVLVDNDGGGIFSQLPQAAIDRPEVGLPEHFEELFGTPHGLDLGPVATALGASHRLVAPDDVGAAVVASLMQPGVKVIAVRTDRARDAELHRAAFAAVRAALELRIGGQR